MIAIYLFGATILGLIFGSFLSMLIPRLHGKEKGIFFGRSHCQFCKHILEARDLIPLLSYIFLGGKCRFCKKKISPWYPLTEISMALLFGLMFFMIKDLYAFLLITPSLIALGFIFFYDLRYKEVHDAVLIPGIIWVLAVSILQGNAVSSLLGAGIAGGFFGLQYLISKGKWIGSGDIYIGIFMGLFLGWQNTLIGLMLGYIIGSVVGVALLISKRAEPNTAVPLGPFLVLGTMLAFLYGKDLIAFYFST